MTKNKTSFYNWCINNNREDFLEMWDYESNDINPKDISFGSEYKAIFVNKDKSHAYKISYITTKNPKKLTKIMEKSIKVKAEKKIKQQNSQGYISINTHDSIKYSFYEWCIDNNRNDILDRWDYDLNEKLPNKYTYKSHGEIYLKCPRTIHSSEKYVIMSITNMNIKIKCRQCNSFGQWLIDNYGEDALDKYWDYDKNTISPYNLACGRKKFYVYLHDFEGDKETYKTSFYLIRRYESRKNNYGNNTRAVQIRKNARHNILEEYPIISEIWSDLNTVNIEDVYKKYRKGLLYWKCDIGIHDDYERSVASSIKSEFRCPECSRERDESFLQEGVRLYLSNELGFKLNHEHNCSVIPINPNTSYPLPFDNEVIDLKLIIEVNGLQHYEVCGFHKLQAKYRNTTPEEEFEYQQWKDKYKKEYALSQGYFYLEIPYWSLINDKYKRLIINKIKEIVKSSPQNYGDFLLPKIQIKTSL